MGIDPANLGKLPAFLGLNPGGYRGIRAGESEKWSLGPGKKAGGLVWPNEGRNPWPSGFCGSLLTVGNMGRVNGSAGLLGTLDCGGGTIGIDGFGNGTVGGTTSSFLGTGNVFCVTSFEELLSLDELLSCLSFEPFLSLEDDRRSLLPLRSSDLSSRDLSRDPREKREEYSLVKLS